MSSVERFTIAYNSYNGFYYVMDNASGIDDVAFRFVARGITNEQHAERIRKLYVKMWQEQHDIDEALGTHEDVEIKYEVIA